jgi:hypothetical protein
MLISYTTYCECEMYGISNVNKIEYHILIS